MTGSNRVFRDFFGDDSETEMEISGLGFRASPTSNHEDSDPEDPPPSPFEDLRRELKRRNTASETEDTVVLEEKPSTIGPLRRGIRSEFVLWCKGKRVRSGRSKKKSRIISVSSEARSPCV